MPQRLSESVGWQPSVLYEAVRRPKGVQPQLLFVTQTIGVTVHALRLVQLGIQRLHNKVQCTYLVMQTFVPHSRRQVAATAVFIQTKDRRYKAHSTVEATCIQLRAL